MDQASRAAGNLNMPRLRGAGAHGVQSITPARRALPSPDPRHEAERAMQLGMIGLGRMGSNMVKRLVAGGHECVVFDRSSAAVQALSLIHISEPTRPY